MNNDKRLKTGLNGTELKGKKGKMKKLVAMILAIMMIAVVGAAFAADNLSSGKYGNGGSSAAASTTEAVNIVKSLMPVNPENSTINAPTITYTYAISSVTADKSITDSANINARTKAGILTGLKVKGSTNGTAGTAVTYSSGDSVSTTIAWTTARALTANTVDNQNLEIDFSNVVFSNGAGVYRYTITESATYTGTGVTETDGTHTRYLDVYVKDGSGTGAAAWDVYGYVCTYANNDSINEGTNSTTNNISSIAKTNGFVEGTDNSGNPISADTYYTYNVTISKTLTGDSYSSTNKFPFTVTFVNTNITANVDIIGGYTGTATADDIGAGPLSTQITKQPTIANGGTATYVGIPVGTTVTVCEKNNQVGTTYNSSATITTSETNDTAAASKAIEYNATSNTATIASTSVNTKANHNKNIAFTNSLALISPTGYIARFAPYALMLIGGVVLLMVAKKHRKHTDDE